MIPKIYEELFIEQAILGFHNFYSENKNSKKMEMLYSRKYLLDKNYIYSHKTRKKTLHLQDILTQKIKETVEFTQEFEYQILDEYEKKDSIITSYYIDYTINLYSHKKYEHIPQMNGKPFFSFDEIFIKEIRTKERYCPYAKTIEPEFTAFHILNHPLQGIYHNDIIHDLFSHHYILSYSDIIDIEEFCIEPKINLDFKITF